MYWLNAGSIIDTWGTVTLLLQPIHILSGSKKV